MAKLTYWVAPVIGDSSCYNIRAKTRKEARALIVEYGADYYSEPVKHTVYYTDAFDLTCQALSESKLNEPEEI